MGLRDSPLGLLIPRPVFRVLQIIPQQPESHSSSRFSWRGSQEDLTNAAAIDPKSDPEIERMVPSPSSPPEHSPSTPTSDPTMDKSWHLNLSYGSEEAIPANRSKLDTSPRTWVPDFNSPDGDMSIVVMNAGIDPEPALPRLSSDSAPLPLYSLKNVSSGSLGSDASDDTIRADQPESRGHSIDSTRPPSYMSEAPSYHSFEIDSYEVQESDLDLGDARLRVHTERRDHRVYNDDPAFTSMEEYMQQLSAPMRSPESTEQSAANNTQSLREVLLQKPRSLQTRKSRTRFTATYRHKDDPPISPPRLMSTTNSQLLDFMKDHHGAFISLDGPKMVDNIKVISPLNPPPAMNYPNTQDSPTVRAPNVSSVEGNEPAATGRTTRTTDSDKRADVVGHEQEVSAFRTAGASDTDGKKEEQADLESRMGSSAMARDGDVAATEAELRRRRTGPVEDEFRMTEVEETDVAPPIARRSAAPASASNWTRGGLRATMMANLDDLRTVAEMPLLDFRTRGRLV